MTGVQHEGVLSPAYYSSQLFIFLKNLDASISRRWGQLLNATLLCQWCVFSRKNMIYRCNSLSESWFLLAVASWLLHWARIDIVARIALNSWAASEANQQSNFNATCRTGVINNRASQAEVIVSKRCIGSDDDDDDEDICITNQAPAWH